MQCHGAPRRCHRTPLISSHRTQKSVSQYAKRTDITSISSSAGPIVIAGVRVRLFGHAGISAEGRGYRIVLVNSNPATIMTDPISPTRPI